MQKRKNESSLTSQASKRGNESLNMRRDVLRAIAALPLAGGAIAAPAERESFRPSQPDAKDFVSYRTVDVKGVKIFYREAGPENGPVLLLLHGYSSSSRMFESIMSKLSAWFRVIAPDYPGFGWSDAPDPSAYAYTFENLSQTILDFSDLLKLERYSLYMQDYGGPVGFGMATARPERIHSLVVQNAVIHEEGLTGLWDARKAYWTNRDAHEAAIREGMFSVPAGIARHVGDRPHLERYNPDLWMDEILSLRRPGIDRIQLNLSFDYQNNLKRYPEWQSYLRTKRPPLLVLWGQHDPLFSVKGAWAMQREQPKAIINVLEAGHFATYDVPSEISKRVLSFHHDLEVA
ncbi:MULTISPECIES: alpha/beta fold hydrolase [Burkholderiaceae]|nr:MULTISPECIES: alpha/beta hydrolase [Burkholderiaceae]